LLAGLFGILSKLNNVVLDPIITLNPRPSVTIIRK